MKNVSAPQSIEISQPWQDYELLDSGDGKILERFGKMVLIRPYPQAFWAKTSPALWKQNSAQYIADLQQFGGKWLTEDKTQRSWPLRWNTLKFQVQLGASQHIGVFPEEINHWHWLDEVLKKSTQPIRLLNLWAYTGLANLIAARAKADLTHVDTSKHGIAWAMANQKLSAMKDAPIRYIQEEPIKFIKREARREKTYNALLLQFPRLEREQESEYADFLKGLPELLDSLKDVLDSNPYCILVTAPTCIQPTTTRSILHYLTNQTGSSVAGQIYLKEKSAGHLLPRATFARWSRD